MSSSTLSSTAVRLFSPKYPHRRLPPSSPISFQRLTSPSPLRSSSPPSPPSAPSPPSPQLDPTTLPPRLQEIISLFQSVPDPKAKYQQLLHYSRHLPPLPLAYKTPAHRVRGCVSQVWLRAFPDPADPSLIQFQADSDSALTKGLAALLVLGLSGSPAPTIAQIPPHFVHLLGLNQSLTPSRNNGFLNMLRLMQLQALRIHSGLPPIEDDSAITVPLNNDVVSEEESVEEAVDVEVGERAGRMRERLERELRPTELVIEDISEKHKGHAGVRGREGGETHFNLRVVAEVFEGKSLVKRHRMVYGILQDEMEKGLHALSIDAKTPAEVEAS